MTNITNIQSEFDQFIPVLKADYVRRHNNLFDYFEKTHGAVNTLSRSNADFCDLVFQRELIPFASPEVPGPFKPGTPLKRNADRIEKDAQENAEQNVASFVAKLQSKLGDLDNVEIANINGAEFTIFGTLGEHKVAVEQRIVFKVSSRGTAFHQFPARIYVDGKFTSEANFKKLARIYRPRTKLPAA